MVEVPDEAEEQRVAEAQHAEVVRPCAAAPAAPFFAEAAPFAVVEVPCAEAEPSVEAEVAREHRFGAELRRDSARWQLERDLRHLELQLLDRDVGQAFLLGRRRLS